MIITICIGSACHLKGSRNVVEGLEELIKRYELTDQVALNGSFCIGRCLYGVCIQVDETHFSLAPEDVEAFFHQEILRRLS